MYPRLGRRESRDKVHLIREARQRWLEKGWGPRRRAELKELCEVEEHRPRLFLAETLHLDCSLPYKGNRQVGRTWLPLQEEPQFLCLEGGFATYCSWAHREASMGCQYLGSSEVSYRDSLGAQAVAAEGCPRRVLRGSGSVEIGHRAAHLRSLEDHGGPK